MNQRKGVVRYSLSNSNTSGQHETAKRARILHYQKHHQFYQIDMTQHVCFGNHLSLCSSLTFTENQSIMETSPKYLESFNLARWCSDVVIDCIFFNHQTSNIKQQTSGTHQNKPYSIIHHVVCTYPYYLDIIRSALIIMITIIPTHHQHHHCQQHHHQHCINIIVINRNQVSTIVSTSLSSYDIRQHSIISNVQSQDINTIMFILCIISIMMQFVHHHYHHQYHHHHHQYHH